MGGSPDIISPRLKPLGHACLTSWISLAARTRSLDGSETYRISGGSYNIEETLQKDPIKTNRVSHLLKSIHVYSMHDWEDGRETEADKHAGSKRAPKRGPELWVHGYNSAAGANCSDLRPTVQN